MQRMVQALLIATGLGEPGVSVGKEMQFDLECPYRGYVAADPHPRFRGTPYEPTWEGVHRFRVDLERMQFCHHWCEPTGPYQIASVDANQIVLFDRPDDNPKVLTTVRRRDGFYMQHMEDDEGYTRITTGMCSVEPFSGFAQPHGGR